MINTITHISGIFDMALREANYTVKMLVSAMRDGRLANYTIEFVNPQLMMADGKKLLDLNKGKLRGGSLMLSYDNATTSVEYPTEEPT